MARPNASQRAADSDTPSALVAQQRIFQLKKERDEKTKDILVKVLADLDDIKDQVSQEREEHERLRRQKRAKILMEIAKSMQKRSAIEQSMTTVVSDLNKAMAQLESNVMEIYDIKERSVQHLIRAGQQTGQ
ncbi:hypothetical protein NLG97_g2656 [Lecanicillium saksenae]|uniref:Uncharacterized protein n=1 Tax=Lecanicillium saksenae TaxID=468837 RepID=A0ACC1R2X2_9HYPO|nr:hypothetical protein NLG97_g2656 [Lecanicillium saksenae]